MDKVEYKIRADEIKALIGENRFAEAVKIADTIDWKRVKSVQMLCMISDLYKINRRFEESKDVLLMAYDRYPTGRAIVYSLCELAIKMGEFVQAVEYYKEFVRIAPRDTGRYILQYKLYEAQEVSLEERIAVLEEFKKHDYREKWVYELAYLYHRVGLTTECIETCDEMFLWLGDGRYVMKALELKALHEPLSPEQQDRYVRYKEKHGGYVDRSIVYDKDEIGKDEPGTVEIKQPTKEMPPVTDEVINAFNNGEAVNEAQAQYAAPAGVDPVIAAPTQELVDSDKIVYPHIDEIKEPSVDVSQYNTMNLQKALAEELKGFIDNDEDKSEEASEPAPAEGFTGAVIKPDTAEIFDEEDGDNSGVFSPMAAVAADDSQGAMQEVFFDATEGESEQASEADFKPYEEDAKGEKADEDEPEDEALSEEKELIAEAKEAAFDEDDVDSEEEKTDIEEHKLNIDIKYGGNGPILGEEKILDYASIPVYQDKPLEEEVPGAVIHPNSNFQMHSHFDNILSQEYDGQISMAVEPEPQVEKQITGQISISEYIENWEQFKKQQQQKQFEQVKKLVADETGDMFADYDEKTKEGLQEKIEQAISDALKKERHDKASGRGDWTRNNSDVIDDAVAEVINNEGVDTEEEQEDSKPEDESVKAEDTSVENAEAKEAATEEKKEDDNTSEETSKDAEQTSEDSENKEAASDTEGEKKDSDDKNAEEKSDKAENSEKKDDSKADDNANSKKPSNSEGKEGRRNKNRNRKGSGNQNQDQNQNRAKKHHMGNRELDERVRTMTPEEKELFGPYIHHKKSRRQIINAIDNLSMDAYSGNAIVTGEEGAGTVNLAKGLIRAVQASDSNFSGKVAKITANTLNKKSPKAIFEKLANGALIIQRAADLEAETVADFIKVLQQENKGIIVIMEDTKEDINRFLDKNPALKQSFNVRVDIEALDDDSLVAYAKQYALEKEFAIDNLGILALHTKISERQTLDHEVTVSEVRDIIDDAIYYAEKHSVSHLMDIIVNKRYDENDMIILREKDFMH